MTGSDLFKEIGNIKEEYIVEAEQYKGKTYITKIRSHSAFLRVLSAAACMILCVGLVMSVRRFGVKVENEVSMDNGAQVQLTEESSAAVGLCEETMEECVTDHLKTGIGNQQFAMETPEAGREEAKAEGEAEATDKNIMSEKKAISEYSNDYEELLNEEDVLITLHGNIEKGRSLWETFQKNVENDIAAQIHIIQFTVEGDAIIKEIEYDGEVFRVCIDNSRDAFRGQDVSYYENTFQYLQKKENELENGEKGITYYLTDCEESCSDEFDTGEKLEILSIYE